MSSKSSIGALSTFCRYSTSVTAPSSRSQCAFETRASSPRLSTALMNSRMSFWIVASVVYAMVPSLVVILRDAAREGVHLVSCVHRHTVRVWPAGGRAELARETGAHHRAFRAGRIGGYARTHRRGEAHGDVRTELRGGEPRRRGRSRGRRWRDAGRAGRLHLRRLRPRPARH